MIRPLKAQCSDLHARCRRLAVLRNGDCSAAAPAAAAARLAGGGLWPAAPPAVVRRRQLRHVHPPALPLELQEDGAGVSWSKHADA